MVPPLKESTLIFVGKLISSGRFHTTGDILFRIDSIRCPFAFLVRLLVSCKGSECLLTDMGSSVIAFQKRNFIYSEGNVTKGI